MKNILTDKELISYLLSQAQSEGQKMKGRIRPHPRERNCPSCGKKFVEVARLGYICPDCKTVPRYFCIDLYHKGQRAKIYSNSKGIPLSSYQLAQELLTQINQEIRDNCFDFSKYVKSEQSKFWLINLYQYWQETNSAKWSHHYKKNVKHAKKYFIQHFGSTKDVRDIKTFEIHSLFQSLIKKLSPKSTYNIINILKSFMNFLKQLDYISQLPNFPKIYVPEPSWKWLTEEQQELIFKHIPTEDLPIFMFMALHGVRPGEARALKVQDVNFELQAITIQRAFSGHILASTKNKRIRTIPIHPNFISVLKELCRNKLPEAFVFTFSKTGRHYSDTSLRRIWKNAAKKAGINIGMYEGLRHSWASQRVSTVPITLISKFLGHSDLRVTRRYTHVDLEALRICVSNHKNDILSIKKKTNIK